MALFVISQSWLNYTKYASADWRLLLRIVTYVIGIVLAVFLFRAGDLLVPGVTWDPSRDARSIATLNRLISGSSVLACVLLSLSSMHELSRSMRCLRRNHQTADSAT